MIGSLRGTLLHRSLRGEIHVEVAGIGHRVVVDAAGASATGAIGSEVFVWVHHHVREDGSTLYGFAAVAERDAFEQLLSVRGVGPNLALAILNVHPPASLAQVVAEGDLDALCLVPGIGKKSAARLLIELQSSFDVPIEVDALDATSDGDGAVLADVRSALAELGYSTEEIREALQGRSDAMSAPVLLREALQRLAVPT